MREIFVKTKHCIGCKSCELMCAVAHSNSRDLSIAIKETPLSISRVKVRASQSAKFVLKRCRHCKKPPCVSACKSSAIYKDENYRTVIDEDKCKGCFTCVSACPFGAMMIEKDRRIVLVCDYCQDIGKPACVASCPTGVFTVEKLN